MIVGAVSNGELPHQPHTKTVLSTIRNIWMFSSLNHCTRVNYFTLIYSSNMQRTLNLVHYELTMKYILDFKVHRACNGRPSLGVAAQCPTIDVSGCLGN